MQIDLETFISQVEAVVAHAGMPNPVERSTQFANSDPFPNISPSLLHSGHIASYAVATGMIDPFDPLCLKKPATYLVSLEGDVQYRDAEGVSHSFFLTKQLEVPGKKVQSFDRSAELFVGCHVEAHV